MDGAYVVRPLRDENRAPPPICVTFSTSSADLATQFGRGTAPGGTGWLSFRLGLRRYASGATWTGV